MPTFYYILILINKFLEFKVNFKFVIKVATIFFLKMRFILRISQFVAYIEYVLYKMLKLLLLCYFLYDIDTLIFLNKFAKHIL